MNCSRCCHCCNHLSSNVTPVHLYEPRPVLSQNLTYLQNPANNCYTFGVNTTATLLEQLQRPNFPISNHFSELKCSCSRSFRNSTANSFKNLERQVALDLAQLQQVLGGPPPLWRLHVNCQTSTTDLTKSDNAVLRADVLNGLSNPHPYENYKKLILSNTPSKLTGYVYDCLEENQNIDNSESISKAKKSVTFNKEKRNKSHKQPKKKKKKKKKRQKESADSSSTSDSDNSDN